MWSQRCIILSNSQDFVCQTIFVFDKMVPFSVNMYVFMEHSSSTGTSVNCLFSFVNSSTKSPKSKHPSLSTSALRILVGSFIEVAAISNAYCRLFFSEHCAPSQTCSDIQLRKLRSRNIWPPQNMVPLPKAGKKRCVRQCLRLLVALPNQRGQDNSRVLLPKVRDRTFYR